MRRPLAFNIRMIYVSPEMKYHIDTTPTNIDLWVLKLYSTVFCTAARGCLRPRGVLFKVPNVTHPTVATVLYRTVL